MNNNSKAVPFGVKQEAVISPKPGYEVESVTVVNTTTNEVVEAEVTKTSDTPPKWTCSFIQPAGAVSIKPIIRPVLYSVVIEECEFCDIILLEHDAAAEIELKAAEETDSAEENTTANEDNDKEVTSENSEQEGETDFSNPQHSFKNRDDIGTVPVLDVEVSDEENKVDESDEDSSSDQTYAAGEFEDELMDIEPVIISQADCDKKNKAFWEHRNAYDAGEISKEKFEEVRKLHMQFLDDVSSGKIVVRETGQ